MTRNPWVGIMRKTSDLINEMMAEAKDAFLVAIAVGLEKETEFVFSSEKQPLVHLNRLIQKGGSPVGLLRFDRADGQVQGSYRPFEEYAGQEWVKTYLAGLLENSSDIAAMGLQQDLPGAY